jgi:diamine N-acetyltransferase
MRWLPYAFYQGEAMVGFVALAYRPEQRSVFWMFHFFIDARYQGQRLGLEALDVLIEEVQAQHPGCQIIQLTVHPENVVAQHRYAQAGFLPTGETLEGEPVYQLRLPHS